jgi:hypothetical protein
MKLFIIKTKFRHNKTLLQLRLAIVAQSVRKAKAIAWDKFLEQYPTKQLTYKKFIINTKIKKYEGLWSITKFLVKSLFSKDPI